jgi:hypothetical protein
MTFQSYNAIVLIVDVLMGGVLRVGPKSPYSIASI